MHFIFGIWIETPVSACAFSCIRSILKEHFVHHKDVIAKHTMRKISSLKWIAACLYFIQ